MYDIIKNVISEKRYDLTGLLRKIDTVWLQGKLTGDEKAELVTLAQDNADPDYSVNVIARLDDLEKRVRAIEDGEKAPAPSEEYKEYDPYHVYLNGDKVTFEGKKYVCTLPEHVTTCSWSPAAYPAYWRAV